MVVLEARAEEDEGEDHVDGQHGLGEHVGERPADLGDGERGEDVEEGVEEAHDGELPLGERLHLRGDRAGVEALDDDRALLVGGGAIVCVSWGVCM